MVLQTKTLGEFESYDSFIVNQIINMKELNKNQNVKGLSCKLAGVNGREQKGYTGSLFHILSHTAAGLSCRLGGETGMEKINYVGSEFERLAVLIKREFKSDPGKFDPRHPSFISILDVPNAYSLPVNLFFTEDHIIRALEVSNCKYDKELLTLSYEQYANLAKDTFIKDYLAEQVPYIKDILTQCKIYGKTVLAQAFTHIPDSFIVTVGHIKHMIAFIGWFDITRKKMVIGIYDSMYFKRKDKGYIWSVEYASIVLHILFATVECPVEIINLSEFCLRGPKGIHCPQYTINAEYCYMYSLYFLYVYAKLGMPRDMEGLQRVVKGTFIVEPDELKRQPCEATNQFRIRMMGFIITVLVLYGTHDKFFVKRIKDVADDVYDNDCGLQLIHPDIQAILDQNMPPPSNPKGGQRCTRKRRKGSHKKSRRRLLS